MAIYRVQTPTFVYDDVANTLTLTLFSEQPDPSLEPEFTWVFVIPMPKQAVEKKPGPQR